MNTSNLPGNPPLSFVDRWYGLLLPLAVVSSILLPVGVHASGLDLPSWVQPSSVALGIGLVVAVLVLDAIQLHRRSREPGFNAWDEI